MGFGTISYWTNFSKIQHSAPLPQLPQFLPQNLLWLKSGKYIEWQRPQCAPSTMKNQYRAYSASRQVAQTVDQISDSTTQANLTAASGILAGIVLKEDVIYRLLRRDIMQESSVYRSILAEGKVETQREIAVNLLRRGIAIDIIAPSTGLSIEEVQQLQLQIAESSQA